MKMALGKLGMTALLALGMRGALALPQLHDRQGGDAARLERQLAWAQATQARRDGEEQQQFDRRGGQDGRSGRDNGQFRDGQRPGGNWQPPSQDEGRRAGRMSPEERRELRRQIDEAGRNIYAPRR